MMPVRRACSAAVACACVVAGLAGCSNGHGPGSSGHGQPNPLNYCPMAAEHAYALDVTTAGRVRWQVPAATPGAVPPELSPLAVGAVAVLSQGGALDGRRLADGRRMWSWTASQVIAGMWRWQGLVVVLADDPDSAGPPLLTGLDAGTGQTRWTSPLDGGVLGFFSTADGGLAILNRFGVPEVVDLSSGWVRWTGPPSPVAGPLDPAMAVAGGALLVALDGRLTSYDDQTGQVRWADTLMPDQLAASLAEPGLQASAGLVYLTGWPGTQALGIRAADGRVEWRFAPGSEQLAHAYAPGLVSVTSSSGRTWQDELDPATGRVRWQAASSNDAAVTPAGIVSGPAGTEPNAGPDGTNQISLRDTLTGKSRWASGLNGSPVLPVVPDGPVLVVLVTEPDGSDLLAALRMSDGHRAWQLTLPEPIVAPLSAVPGGVLVDCANVVLPC